MCWERPKKTGQNFCTLSFLVLTACRYAGFRGEWRDMEGSGQIHIKAVIEGLTKGLSSPGFSHRWAEQGHYSMSRCCRKLENSEGGKCCKTSTRARSWGSSKRSLAGRDKGKDAVGGLERAGPWNGCCLVQERVLLWQKANELEVLL